MSRKIVCIPVLVTLFILPALLLAEDSLTITTYYPSPYGAYNKLQSNKLAVGDTNADSEMTSADLPSANGQIYAARGIILKPQSSLPSSDNVTGELAYNNSDKKLYHYDGSAWAAVGGSSSSGVTMLSAKAGPYNHANACKYCYDLSSAAAVSMTGDTTTVYTDWRLPTAAEAAVFEGTVTDTSWLWTLNLFVETYYYDYYWSIINLSNGTWSGSAYNTSTIYVRCVR